MTRKPRFGRSLAGTPGFVPCSKKKAELNYTLLN
jgi:hypothetical protein